MPIYYPKTKIENDVMNAHNDMDAMYKQPFINYIGHIKEDEGILDSELISSIFLDHVDEWFLGEKIHSVKRLQGYFPPTHDAESRHNTSNREEEKIAMFYYKSFESGYQDPKDEIGTILDYQTPLKEENDDSIGKVDLLSIDNDKNILFLELKKTDSKETLLRCIVESFSYTKFVDRPQFTRDLKEKKNVEFDKIIPCALFFKDSQPYEDYEHVMDGSCPATKELIKKLGCRLYCIEEIEKKGDERRFKSTLLPID